MVSDGYVKYEEVEVDRSAIMQDYRDDDILFFKWPTGSHLGFYFVICHGLSLCETLHFVLYSWSIHFAFFLELHKYHTIINIQNGH